MKKISRKKRARKEILDYDDSDTSKRIDPKRRLKFEDLGVRLPDLPPTQVVSIRLPSKLLNELKAFGSQRDVPYQALIKLLLSESLERMKKRAA